MNFSQSLGLVWARHAGRVRISATTLITLVHEDRGNELVQGVAMSTSADTPFRSFVQTQIFSVSPSSFSLQEYSNKHQITSAKFMKNIYSCASNMVLADVRWARKRSRCLIAAIGKDGFRVHALYPSHETLNGLDEAGDGLRRAPARRGGERIHQSCRAGQFKAIAWAPSEGQRSGC